MSWNTILGLISCTALLLPAGLLILFRLGLYRTFPVLIAYYLIGFIDIATGRNFTDTPGSFHYYWAICNNLLEAPLLLWFLTYFSTNPVFKKLLHYTVAGFLVYECVIIGIIGFSSHVLPCTIGVGQVLVFGFTLSLLIRQARIAITNHKTTGKALILASILFSIGSYFFIYIMYYVMRAYMGDADIVLFTVNSFSAIMVCTGIFIERKRVYRLNEIRTTRRELLDVYSTDKAVVKFPLSVPEFSNERWN